MFIIVKQYETRSHGDPSSFITQLPTDEGLYGDTYGNSLFPVFENFLDAQKVCDNHNKDNYFKYKVIPIELYLKQNK